MKKAVLIMLALMSSLGYAQNLQNANWLFGEYAGLNFNPSPPPTPLSPSVSTGMNAHEGCATISYPDGSLMFYTNSNRVWNKNHQVMPNGTGLIGSDEGSQNAVIIPRPNDNTRFFVVTLDGYLGGQKGLYYSEVDMTLNSGLGDVISASKNTVLNDHTGVPIGPSYGGTGNLSHRITYYPHANGHDYWLVTQIDKFVFSHLVTETGIGPNAAQAAIAPWIANYGPNATGQMKISPDGTKIAMAYSSDPSGTGAVFLGSFNSATGAVSIAATSIASAWGYYWGVEFSPNSQILYYNAETSVYAYEIPTAKTETVGAFTDPDTSLQLAIDGRIYIATRELNKISHIKYPDTFGVGCTYEYAVVPLGSRLSHRGLPGWVYWQNQKLWPRTFSSVFVRAEPRYIETDVDGNVYYLGQMHNDMAAINTRSHEDNDFIIPYWNEHTQPGFNPANYSQPQFSFMQLLKLDKYGNTIWHKPVNYQWEQTHIRKTTDRIFIYKDAASAGDPYIKEVVSLNNATIMAPFTHTWGAYNGTDQSGYEIYVRKIATNNFIISLVQPNTNAVVTTISFTTSGTPLVGCNTLKIAYCAGTDYIFWGDILCTGGGCGTTLTTNNVVAGKRVGSSYTLNPSILYQYINTLTNYKEFQHLFFNNKLFLGYFNENIYETFVSATSPVDANIKIFNYSPGTFTGTGITITTSGDYLYSMSTVNNKVLYVGHKRLYEGVAGSNYSPGGVITFPGDAAGAIATYDNLGNIILAGKYWQQPTLTLPGGTQNLLAYGGGYVYPANPYTYPNYGAGHHFVTKFKPISGGYSFYRPGAGNSDKVKEGIFTDEITLYPNPAIKEFTVQSDREFTNYEVWGIDGKLMGKGEFTAGEQLKVDVSGFAKGNYFIKLFDKAGKEESRQFIKI